jgi:hypothetical protein
LDIYYSEYDGDIWTVPVNISQLSGQSCYPKIVLDSQDYPCVVWEQHYGGYHIYYSSYDGQKWTVPEKLSTEEKSVTPTIAVDSKDRVYIVWSVKINQEKELRWRFYDASWSDIFMVSTTSARSALPQIKIYGNDFIHVIFSGDSDENRDIFYTRRSFTWVEPQVEEDMPQEYKLRQNYPNPFNQETVIRYSLAGDELNHVTLKIYNLLGKEVITLVDGLNAPGEYEVVWDGRDKKGVAVSSGVYIYHLQGKSLRTTKKMVILR